jgi:hypothetical protein
MPICIADCFFAKPLRSEAKHNDTLSSHPDPCMRACRRSEEALLLFLLECDTFSPVHLQPRMISSHMLHGRGRRGGRAPGLDDGVTGRALKCRDGRVHLALPSHHLLFASLHDAKLRPHP